MEKLTLTDEMRAALADRARCGLEGKLRAVAVDPKMLDALLRAEQDARAINRGVALTNSQLRGDKVRLSNEVAQLKEELYEARGVAQVAICKRHLLSLRVGNLAMVLRRLSAAARPSAPYRPNTVMAPIPQLFPAHEGRVSAGPSIPT